ncbi:MAG: hypothetical protein M1833_002807 [Piccolia ochrophora]|nr:MAG: hypothetical protein M1833_002807 [Piccolia ochrophora]
MYSTGFYDLSLLQLAASVPAPRIIVSWRDEIPTSDSPWSPLDANNLDYFSQTQRFFTIESGGSRSLMINFKTAQPKSGERVIPFKRRPATAITIKIARRPIAPPPEQVLTSEPPSDLIDMEAEFPAYLPPEFVLPLPAPAQGSSTAGGSSGHLLDS